MFLTIIIFIIVLGVLVFVHEFGHFFVAKRTGMKVEEFGFGFPPRLAGIQKVKGKWRWVWGHKGAHDKDETVYSINWIPFGGFVKIMGENNEQEDDPRSFINRPAWARFLTLIAGVSMNWLLAALLFSLTFMVGITSEVDMSSPAFRNANVTDRQVAIGYVEEGLPAQTAGLQPGDIILQIDEQDFTQVGQVQDYIKANKGKDIQFKVKRLNQTQTYDVKSLENPGPDQGPTGIGLAEIGKVKLPFFQAIGVGIAKTANITVLIFTSLWDLLFAPWVYPLINTIFNTSLSYQAPDFSQVGGPVKIAQLTGEVASLGFVPLMNFTALLSINLAILNILPFPALDGGRILFLGIEKVRGKRNNQRVEQFVNAAGFLLLLMLMVVVTAKDVGLGRVISRIFGE